MSRRPESPERDTPSESKTLPPPALDCFRIEPDAPAIPPAAIQRDWMDATTQRFAYRCTPMAIANASGWELRCPFDFEAAWDGTNSLEAITVVTSASRTNVERLVASHFGHGVLTFHIGWLFRRPPGWALWVRGNPNQLKDGIIPLDGLVETDWLPFTFSMNWRFTRPGRVCFKKDEPFCFMTLSPHGALDDIQPILRDLADDPVLAADYSRWRDSRTDFNARLRSNDAGTLGQGWQKTYVHGAESRSARAFHISKRKLSRPK